MSLDTDIKIYGTMIQVFINHSLFSKVKILAYKAGNIAFRITDLDYSLRQV